jgi:hypothetical protein
MKTYGSGDTAPLTLDPGINKEVVFKIIHNKAQDK